MADIQQDLAAAAPETGTSGQQQISHSQLEVVASNPRSQQPTEPKALRVLVIDSKGSSRTAICSLLRECEYQVKAVKTSVEALQYLLQQQGPDSNAVDLVIKEHEPPAADAGRLLRKMARSELLRRTPVVVVSSHDEREVVMNCLALGAIDYLVKPLRHNELRHIWTRVWWWRRSGLGAPIPLEPQQLAGPNRPIDLYGRSYQSSESKETKCEEEEEPTSKEGSAPDGNNGSNGNGQGSNGSKDGNGTSRVEAKPHDNGDGTGNGSSDNKNGHNGSNGNGASTTLAAERNGTHPLAHTAEGRAPQNLMQHEAQTLPKVATGRSLAFPNDAYNTPPASSSRKRPYGECAEAGGTPNGGVAGTHKVQSADGGGKNKQGVHRDRSHDRERAAGLERLQAAGRNSGNHAVRQGPFSKNGSGSHPSQPSIETNPHQPTQGSGHVTLTRNGTIMSWPSLGQSAPNASQHLQPPLTSQSGALPPMFPPNAFGLPHMLPQALAALSMYAAHANPGVGPPGMDMHGVPHQGMIPLLASMYAMQSNALNQQQQPAKQQQDGTVEACSSAGIGSSHHPGSGSAGGIKNESSASISGLPVPNPLLIAQYLQAMSQLNHSTLGPHGPAGMQPPPGPQAQAQAALAAALANTALGGMPVRPNPFFPHTVRPHVHHPHHHHHHHHHHMHNADVPADQQQPVGNQHAAAAHTGMQSMASNNNPGAAMLAMQQTLLANPALSVAAAVMAGAGLPGSPASRGGLAGPGPAAVGPTGMPISMSGSIAPGQTSNPNPSSVAANPTPSIAGGNNGMEPTVQQHPAYMMVSNPFMPGALPIPPPGYPPSMIPPGFQQPGAASEMQASLFQQSAAPANMGEGVGTRKRRALALDKYRQKRKNLKFSSAIRYETRKVQAQSRPRIKGQFAKAINPKIAELAGSGDATAEGSTEGLQGLGTGLSDVGCDGMTSQRPVTLQDEEDEEYDQGMDDDEAAANDAQQPGNLKEGQGTSNTPYMPLHGSAVNSNDNSNRWASRPSHRPRAARKHYAAGSLGDVGSGWQSVPMQIETPVGDDKAVGQEIDQEVMTDEGTQADGEALGDEEEDVVNSLRELKEGPHRATMKHVAYPHSHSHHRTCSGDNMAPCMAAHCGKGNVVSGLGLAHGITDCQGQSSEREDRPMLENPPGALAMAVAHAAGMPAGPQPSLSQSGMAASKGSHGRPSQHARSGTPAVRAASGHLLNAQAAEAGGTQRADNRDLDANQPPQRVSGHGGVRPTGERTSHGDAGNGHNTNGSNGKNGSDSGSNSPDENGGNGGSGTRQRSGSGASNKERDQEATASGSHDHAHAHGHGHAHANTHHPNANRVDDANSR